MSERRESTASAASTASVAHSKMEAYNAPTLKLFEILKAGSSTSPTYGEVKALIKRGANVTVEDDDDKSPFQLATQLKNEGAKTAITEAATAHYKSTEGVTKLEGESLKVSETELAKEKKALGLGGRRTRKRKHRKSRRKTRHRR